MKEVLSPIENSHIRESMTSIQGWTNLIGETQLNLHHLTLKMVSLIENGSTL